MTDVLSPIIHQLSQAGIDSPRLEARMLIAEVLNCDIDELPIDISISNEQQLLLDTLLKRRLSHEPLDKILGYRDFYKYRFIVDHNVLSPRPDSEILVEEAIKLARANNFSSVLEFGVGSGCLIISILADITEMHGLGLEKSASAIKIATQNAKNIGVANRLALRLFDYFVDDVEGSFPLIISNPPYISTNEISALDIEVKDYDPLIALDGGSDGYDHYRRLAQIVPNILQSQGFLLLEGGQGQADTIASIFEQHGLHLVKKACDLSGIERCIILQK